MLLQRLEFEHPTQASRVALNLYEQPPAAEPSRDRHPLREGRVPGHRGEDRDHHRRQQPRLLRDPRGRAGAVPQAGRGAPAPAVPRRRLRGLSAGRRRASCGTRGFLLLALLLSGAVVGGRHRLAQDPTSATTASRCPPSTPTPTWRMADHPAFFTVSPWGYRLLTPWLRPRPARGQRGARLPLRDVRGADPRGRAAVPVPPAARAGPVGGDPGGCSAFALSPPVGQAIRNRFLAEPLGIVLVLAFLLALEAGAGLAVLCLLAVLPRSARRACSLILLPLVFFVSLRPRRAVARPAGGGDRLRARASRWPPAFPRGGRLT